MNISKTLALLMLMTPLLAPAVELKPNTLHAFEGYIATAEAEMDRYITQENKFLVLDESAAHTARARNGETVIEHLGESSMVKVPSGLIHDWIGAIFVPGATLDEAMTFVQDYGAHEDYYGPEVIQSRLISHNGDDFHIYYRLLKKKVLTVVLDTEHEVKYERIDDRRVRSRSYATRISEVKNAGKKNESFLPDGRGGGYLWRLNSYWKFEERDGGVYVELRAISLTRGIPTGTGWIVKPIVKDMPRVSIDGTLTNTRNGLSQGRAAAAAKVPATVD
jgi:hypothetical protein